MRESILPDVRAHLVERFIFNFRLPPEILERHLPPWLSPQVLGDSAVASFCILDLAGVTFGPVPSSLGLRNINAAHRFGVRDASTGKPGVFVDERNTNSQLASFITSLGFPGHHRYVDAGIQPRDGAWHIQVRDERDSPVFLAEARRGKGFASELFRDLDAFSEFMADGTRSYCPAVRAGHYNVVDLEKSESTYEPLEVHGVSDRLISEWLGLPSQLPLDSAVRTTGGTYVWKYRGRAEAGAGGC